jgi:hypothetical protein
MDLFNTLGQALGNIDTMREQAEAGDPSAPWNQENATSEDLKEYTVDVTISLLAFDKQDAGDFVEYLLKRAKMPGSVSFDIENVIES